jgi:hypothetical protein
VPILTGISRTVQVIEFLNSSEDVLTRGDRSGSRAALPTRNWGVRSWSAARSSTRDSTKGQLGYMVRLDWSGEALTRPGRTTVFAALVLASTVAPAVSQLVSPPNQSRDRPITGDLTTAEPFRVPLPLPRARPRIPLPQPAPAGAKMDATPVTPELVSGATISASEAATPRSAQPETVPTPNHGGAIMPILPPSPETTAQTPPHRSSLSPLSVQ